VGFFFPILAACRRVESYAPGTHQQQLAYLAQKRSPRLYAPGVILGVYTPDELDQPTERDMGPAEVVGSRSPRPAQADTIPEWPDDAFNRQLPKWRDAIKAGARTAEDIIKIAGTKGVLTAKQKAAICAAAQPEPEPEVIDAPEQKAQADDDGWLEDYESSEAGR